MTRYPDGTRPDDLGGRDPDESIERDPPPRVRWGPFESEEEFERAAERARVELAAMTPEEREAARLRAVEALKAEFRRRRG